MSKLLHEISFNEMQEICNSNFCEHNCGKKCPLSCNDGKNCYYELHKELDSLRERQYNIEQFLLHHQRDKIKI